MHSNASKALLLLVTVAAAGGIALLRDGPRGAVTDRPATGRDPAEGLWPALTDAVREVPANWLPAFDLSSRTDGSADGQAGLDAPDVAINIGTLPAGKSVTIVFDATVNSPLTGSATQACNQGTVTATSPAASIVTNDPDTVAADDATCIGLARPDLTVVKSNTVGGAATFPSTWDWHLDVANTGTLTATFAISQVILIDDLPNTNVSYSAPIVSNQAGIGGTGTVGCSIATFTLTCRAIGGTVTIADPGGFRVTTTATPTATGTFANPRAAGVCAVDPDLNVVESNDGNNSCADTVTVTIPGPDLTATKTNTVSGATTIGNTWDWQIDVANTGTLTATFAVSQVILIDDLPNTNVGYSAAIVSNQVGIGGTGTISCSIATFTLTCRAIGGTVIIATPGGFRVTTTATPSAIGIFANPRAAGVCGVDPDLNVLEADDSNNTCADTVTVTNPAADLTATKTNTVTGAVPLGNTWDWRIDVANAGDLTATFAMNQVILRDNLPNTNVSYTAPAVSLPVGIGGTGTINCTIVTFDLTCTASGGTVTLAAAGSFRVTTTATPTAIGMFANPRAAGVCAVDPDLNVTESNNGNNACADTVTVTNPAPDLTATKTNTVGGSATFPGTWDWRIDVANVGNLNAAFTVGQVILKDDLPNTNIISYSAPAVSNQVGITGPGTIDCAIASFTLTCTATGGPVTIAAAGGFRVTTNVTPGGADTFANPRAAGVCVVDPNLNIAEVNDGNNSCADTVTAIALEPDLTATKTNTVAGATMLGNTWDWRIDVANTGNITATFTIGQVILKDDLPATNVSYSPVSLSNMVGLGGTGTLSCTIVANTLTCIASGGTVSIGAPGGFRVTTTATATATGTFANPRAAGVCAVDPDLNITESNEGNNGCADTVTVSGAALTAIKTGPPNDTVVLGESWDWRIDVANTGNAPATFPNGTVILRDDLPNVNVSYTGPTVSNQSGLGGPGTMNCAIASFTLTCTATGGAVTLAGPAGTFRVTVTASATALGSYANPRMTAIAAARDGDSPDQAGVCAVDPDGVVPENNNANNNCSNTVTVLAEPTAARLLFFTARATKLGVSLDWETASEADVKGFRLERATTGGAWTPVGDLVPAQGSAAAGARYSLRDLPEVGLHRYRLTAVDSRLGVAGETLGYVTVRVWSRPVFLPQVTK